MANRPRRRHLSRVHFPGFQALEPRQLLSLDLTMLGQAPVLRGVNTGLLDLASFSFSTGSLADYTASVDWGDGMTTPAMIYDDGDGTAAVVADHAFATSGTATLNVSVSGNGESASDSTTVSVSGAPLSAAVASFTPIWGQPYNGLVATFSSPSPTASPGDFTATIHWGDGSTSAGTISAFGSGLFSISGSHTYAGTGPYTLLVQVSDSSGSSASAGAVINDDGGWSGTMPGQPLAATGVEFPANPNEAFSGQVATFTESTSSDPGDFSAVIDWGDGTTSAGSIDMMDDGSGRLEVTGGHTYVDSAFYAVTTTVVQTDGETATAGSIASVAPSPLSATGVLFSATAGEAFSGIVATVADLRLSDRPGDLSALIDWGDGVTSSGLIVFDSNGGFDVIGTHVYTQAATSDVSVQVSDHSGHSVTAASVATVAEASLAVTAISIATSEGSSFNQNVADFTSANANASAADFTATIDWGDGNTSAGSVADDSENPGLFHVGGSHTYAHAGSYSVTITVAGQAGASASAVGTAVVDDRDLHLSPASISATAGTGFEGTVATFTDDNPGAAAADFTATILWGDGHSSPGTIADDPNVPGQFDVIGTHTFGTPGSLVVSVRVLDSGGSSAWGNGSAFVTDPPLTATGSTFSATVGTVFAGTVATFSDGNLQVTAGAFIAVIDWGDGTTSAGMVVADPSVAGQFDVTGYYTFAAPGSYTVSVQITDVGGSTASASGTADVAAMPLGVTVRSLGMTAGAAFSGTVALLADGGSDPAGNDTATIDWGDGTTTTGTITASTTTPGRFDVSGSHTYASVGTYTVSVTVVDDQQASASATGTASVSNLATAGTTRAATAGSAFSGVVATFTDNDSGLGATDFTATIDWGDGTTSSATIAADGSVSGQFDASGSHTYAKPGAYEVHVEVIDPSSPSSTASGVVLVADAAITASGVNVSPTEGAVFSGIVATFTDGNPQAQAADFGAVVDWGDGSLSTGTITADPNVSGRFDVSASHLYTQQGSFSLGVTLISQGGSTATATASATVADAPLAVQFGSVSARGGSAFNGLIATFTHGPRDSASDFTATIDWGDGTTTAGTIAAILGTVGHFSVSGSHVYQDEGSLPVVVTVDGRWGESTSASGTAHVTDTAGVGATVLPVAGIEYTGRLATFTNDNPDAVASDFTATIDWGDGTTTAGTITADSGAPGQFDVDGTHTYAAPGLQTIQVVVADAAGSTTIVGLAGVSAAPLHVTASSLSVVAGSAYAGTVATFVDGGSDPLNNDTATIDWGDGTTSSATIAESTTNPGEYTVHASHTYASVGSYTMLVTVADSDGSADSSIGTVSVSNMAGAGASIAGTEGSAFSGLVATFTDADGNLTAGDFTATIDWGDGTTSPATIEADGSVSGQFDASGTHSYTEAGTYAVSIVIVDLGGHSSRVATTASIADAAINLAGFTLAGTEGALFTGVVATFTDANPSALPTDFSATIDWGDGTTSTASVTFDALVAGQFDVAGTHTYESASSATVTVHVFDVGGASASATGTAEIDYAPLVAHETTTGVPVGAGSTLTVATFTQGPGEAAGDYSATIDWGDGTTTTAGTITADSSVAGQFDVTGTHTYASVGTAIITVTISGPASASATVTSQASVTSLSGTGDALSATEGSAFQGAVASFSDPASGVSPSDFIATIDWGDNNSSPGTVTAQSGGGFLVSGSHVYGLSGSYVTRIWVSGPGNDSTTIAGTATVAVAPLVVAGRSVHAQAGRSYQGSVATFTKGNSDPVSEFSATIDWGDGTTTAGTIGGPSASADYFTVSGDHAYSAVGSYTVSVTVHDANGASQGATSTATVSNLAVGAMSFEATAGSEFWGTIASFTDTDWELSESDFTATIDWGDGNTSSGSINSDGMGGFTVDGDHTYAGAGTFTVGVVVDGPGGDEAEASASASVAGAGINGSGESISASVGTPFSGQVATFTDGDASATAGSFLVVIHWGDGSVSSGTVTADPSASGQFDVSGSHTYTADGSPSLSIDVFGPGGTFASLGGSASVGTTPLEVSALAISAATGTTFNGLVASFTANENESASNFTANIDWGDGTTSIGAVAAPSVPGGAFWISSHHVYTADGSYTISVTVSDSSDSQSSSSTATVSAVGLAGRLIQATVASTATFVVASFTDNNPDDPVSDYSATIDWGDGTTSGGVIQPNPYAANTYDVKATRSFAAWGNYTIAVQVNDGATEIVAGAGSAAVANARLTAYAISVVPTVGVSFTGTVATLTDANPNGVAGNYSATIDWGDGTTTAASITVDPNHAGRFDVDGTHTYTKVGTSPVTVQITETGGGRTSASSTARVADAPVTAVEQQVAATEGTRFVGTVATFLDANPFAKASDFTATIDWGDGTVSSATIVADPLGGFDVGGIHTYAKQATYTLQIQVADSGGSASSTRSTAVVADAPLSAAPDPTLIRGTAGSQLSGTVASFVDANPSGSAGDFTATVDWGDGTTSTGTISPGGNGNFVVTATHTYGQAGEEEVTVTVHDSGGSTLTLSNTADIADPAIRASGTVINGAAGTSAGGLVASFSNGNTLASAEDFSATISWGDGSTSDGTITADLGVYGQFDVSGTHSYSAQGTYPVLVWIHASGGQSATASTTAMISSSSSALALAISGAAGSFNPDFSGSGDTNTASFDLGVFSLTPLTPNPNGSSSDGASSFKANTATISVSAGTAAPVSGSFARTYTIASSGSSGSPAEVVSVSEVQVVSGTASAGTFHQTFSLSIQSHALQTSSTYGQVGNNDVTDTMTVVVNAWGTYSVSGGQTTITGAYTTSQTDTTTTTVANSSSSFGSTTSLSETSTTQSSYSESGSFNIGPSTSSITQSSTISISESDSYSTVSSFTALTNGGTMTQVMTSSGVDSFSYTEHDFVSISGGLITSSSSYQLTQSSTGSSTAMMSFSSATDSETGTATTSFHAMFADQGSSAQLPGTSTSADTFTLSTGDNSQSNAMAMGSFSGDGVSGSFTTSQSSSGSNTLSMMGTSANINGLVTRNASRNSSTNQSSSSSSSDNGSFSGPGGFGTFSDSSTNSQSTGFTDSGTLTVIGSSVTISGNSSTTSSGSDTSSGSSSNHYNNGGSSGSTTSSSTVSDTYNTTSSTSISATDSSFTVTGHSTSLQTTDISYSDSDQGSSSGLTDDFGTTTFTSDTYNSSDSGHTSITTTGQGGFSASESGSSSHETVTQNSSASWSSHSSDSGTIVINSGSSVDRISYQDQSSDSGSFSSNLVATSVQGSGGSSISGTFSSGSSDNGSASSSSTDKYSSSSSGSSEDPGDTSSSSSGGTSTDSESSNWTSGWHSSGSFVDGSSSGNYTSASKSTSTSGFTDSGKSTSTSSWGGSTSTYSSGGNVTTTSTSQDSGSFSSAGTFGTSTTNTTEVGSYSSTNSSTSTSTGFDIYGGFFTESDSSTSTATETIDASAQNTSNYSPSGSSGTYSSSSKVTATSSSSGKSNGTDTDYLGTASDNSSYGGSSTEQVTSTDSGSYDPGGSTGTSKVTGTATSTSTSKDGLKYSTSFFGLSTTGSDTSSESGSVSSSYTSTNNYSPGGSNSNFSDQETTQSHSSNSGSATTTGPDSNDFYYWSSSNDSNGTTTSTGSSSGGITTETNTSSQSSNGTSDDGKSHSSSSNGGTTSSNWSEFDTPSSSSSNKSTLTIDGAGNILYQSSSYSSSQSDSYTYSEQDSSESSYSDSTSSSSYSSTYTLDESFDESQSDEGSASGTPDNLTGSDSYSISQSGTVNSSQTESNYTSVTDSSTYSTSLTISSDYSSTSDTSTYDYSDSGDSPIGGSGTGSDNMSESYSYHQTYSNSTSTSSSYTMTNSDGSDTATESYSSSSTWSSSGSNDSTDTAGGSAGNVSETTTSSGSGTSDSSSGSSGGDSTVAHSDSTYSSTMHYSPGGTATFSGGGSISWTMTANGVATSGSTSFNYSDNLTNTPAPDGGNAGGGGFLSDYWYYLTNPGAMDGDLQFAQNIAIGTAITAGSMAGGALAAQAVGGFVLAQGGGAVAVGAASGLAGGVVGDVLTQGASIAVGWQDSFNPTRTLISGGTGLLFGAALGKLFAKPPEPIGGNCFVADTAVLMAETLAEGSDIPGEVAGIEGIAEPLEEEPTFRLRIGVVCVAVGVAIGVHYAYSAYRRREREDADWIEAAPEDELDGKRTRKHRVGGSRRGSGCTPPLGLFTVRSLDS